jgi:predicted transposase YbfD/YdcC
VQSTASLAALDMLSDEERAALLAHDSLRSLVDVFASIPDPRSCHGRRYDLPFLLSCLATAFLCGCNSTDAVGQWCRDHRPLLRHLFGPRKHLTPSGSLYRRLIPRLSADHFEWALASWVLHTRPATDQEPVALDGKTLCGAATGEDRAPHLLSVSTHQSDETLLQVRVDAKTNEIPVAQELLGWLVLTDRVITADAMHTHADFAQAVLDQGGHYLLVVKANQPLLHTDLVDYFTDPASAWTEATTVDRQHGRWEERRLRVTSELAAHLAFPGVQQAMEIRRRVRTGGKEREESWYAITDCRPQQADAPALLQLIRGHWSIECRHWKRDVLFGEDKSQIRTKAAPQFLAALRNALLTLLRRTGHTAIAAARRSFSAHPRQAARLIRRPFPSTR